MLSSTGSRSPVQVAIGPLVSLTMTRVVGPVFPKVSVAVRAKVYAVPWLWFELGVVDDIGMLMLKLFGLVARIVAEIWEPSDTTVSERRSWAEVPATRIVKDGLLFVL